MCHNEDKEEGIPREARSRSVSHLNVTSIHSLCEQRPNNVILLFLHTRVGPKVPCPLLTGRMPSKIGQGTPDYLSGRIEDFDDLLFLQEARSENDSSSITAIPSGEQEVELVIGGDPAAR